MKSQAMTKSKEVTNSEQARHSAEQARHQTTTNDKKPTMKRAITIRLQTIQANNHLLQLKTPNNRKRIKSKKSNSLVQQTSIQATATPLLVEIVSRLLIHR